MNSMTGFGRATASAENYSLTVEIKSVNHRFLDVSFKMPQLYAQCESKLLKEIRNSVKRGHLDVVVIRRNVMNNGVGDTASIPSINQAYLEHYLATAKQVISAAGANEADVMPLVLANLIDKRELVKIDYAQEDGARLADELTAEDLELITRTVKEALAELSKQRAEEGDNLKNVLKELFEKFESVCDDIKCVAAEIPKKFHERLKTRLQNLASDVDVLPDRLAQETAILADRVDVTEEQARLDSHCSAFESVAGFGDGTQAEAYATLECGRKMDFLIQEMGREINTIGSKAQDSDISQLVVDAKAILEKMREQVQNIE